MLKKKSRSKSPRYIRRSDFKVSSRSKSRSKSKVRIPVRKSGELKKYGYDIYISAAERRAALAKAVKKYGALSVFRKLNVLVIFNKNKHPDLSKKFKSDRDWVGKNYI
jgi:hypothetical protein